MKKFKLIIGAVALFALVVANVWNAATVKTASALNMEDVEAIAQEPEPGTSFGFTYSSSNGIHVWFDFNMEPPKFKTENAEIKCKYRADPKKKTVTTATYKIEPCISGGGLCFWSDSRDCKDHVPSGAVDVEQIY